MKTTVNQRIIDALKFSGVTQEELANELGVKRSAISLRISRGEILDYKFLNAVSKLTEIPVDEILHGDSRKQERDAVTEKFENERKEQLDKIRSELKDEVKTSEKDARIKDLEAEVAKLVESREHLKNTIKSNETSIKVYEKLVERLESDLANRDSTIASLEIELKEFRSTNKL